MLASSTNLIEKVIRLDFDETFSHE